MKMISRMLMTTALAMACLSPHANAIGLSSPDRLKASTYSSQTTSFFGSVLDSIEGWFHALIGAISSDG
jgi:hypothetical protein